MPERTYSFIEMRLPMPLMSAAAESGKLNEAVAHIAAHDVELGRIARSEAHYFRGQPEEAHADAAPFLDHSDPALRISANFICAYADLTLGKIWETRECLANITAMRNDESIKATPALHASYMLFDAASSVLLHLPTPYPPGAFAKHIAALPEGLRLFGIYALAHHAYLFGEYGRCVGMAETALMTKQGRYPIAEQFLHLVAAMGQMNLKDVEAARRHFMGAWDIALADGLVEEIDEHHGLLQGVLETCLKEDYPEHYARVIDITYRFSEGWRRLHNPETGAHVTSDLTTTEFSIAMLASRGWSNTEIANHLGISTGTVKTACRWHTRSSASQAAQNSRNTCCNSERECRGLTEFKQPNRQSAPRSHHRIPHLSCCSAQANRRHLARIGTYKHSSAWIPPPLGPLRSKPPRSICAWPSPKSHL